MPTTDIDQLLRTVRKVLVASFDPGATGVSVMYTVPDGKKGRVIGYYWRRTAGVTITSDGHAISGVLIESWTATGAKKFTLQVPIWMKEKETFGINIDAWLLNDTHACDLLVEEEDAY